MSTYNWGELTHLRSVGWTTKYIYIYIYHGWIPYIIHFKRMFHEINHPTFFGYPYDLGNLHTLSMGNFFSWPHCDLTGMMVNVVLLGGNHTWMAWFFSFFFGIFRAFLKCRTPNYLDVSWLCWDFSMGIYIMHIFHGDIMGSRVNTDDLGLKMESIIADPEITIKSSGKWSGNFQTKIFHISKSKDAARIGIDPRTMVNSCSDWCMYIYMFKFFVPWHSSIIIRKHYQSGLGLIHWFFSGHGNHASYILNFGIFKFCGFAFRRFVDFPPISVRFRNTLDLRTLLLFRKSHSTIRFLENWYLPCEWKFRHQSSLFDVKSWLSGVFDQIIFSNLKCPQYHSPTKLPIYKHSSFFIIFLQYGPLQCAWLNCAIRVPILLTKRKIRISSQKNHHFLIFPSFSYMCPIFFLYFPIFS